jgi:hypothetical protein
MDRKHCVLLYSKYSQASIDLLSYIKGLPLDFPKVTGMTMICIDNDGFKNTLEKNGVRYVPTLLVEYYKGATPHQTKQKFEQDYIYKWIDQVMKELHFEWPQVQAPDQDQDQGRGRTMLGSGTATNAPSAPPNGAVIDVAPPPDVPQVQKKDKVDITSLAKQMAKDRDSYISETTPEHKKGRPQ